MGNICLEKTFINGYKSLFFFSEFGNGIPQNIVTTATPRLTWFHLTRISVQRGFGLGTKKFT